MGTIIIIFLSTIVFLMFSNHRRNKKTAASVQIQMRNAKNTSRHALFHAREQRLKRHTRIWVVLRFMLTYNDLMESKNFHELINHKKSHEEAKERMREEQVKGKDIETAIRFCHIENFHGTCQYSLKDLEIKQLHEWQNIRIDERELLNNVLKSYQAYWGKVLDSYKRPSARKNRLEYLIKDLDEISALSYVQEYPDVTEKIKALQNAYSVELAKS